MEPLGRYFMELREYAVWGVRPSFQIAQLS